LNKSYYRSTPGNLAAALAALAAPAELWALEVRAEQAAQAVRVQKGQGAVALKSLH
jgi:hypothetical protein